MSSFVPMVVSAMLLRDGAFVMTNVLVQIAVNPWPVALGLQSAAVMGLVMMELACAIQISMGKTALLSSPMVISVLASKCTCDHLCPNQQCISIWDLFSVLPATASHTTSACCPNACSGNGSCDNCTCQCQPEWEGEACEDFIDGEF
jgi:hypothetical protein